MGFVLNVMKNEIVNIKICFVAQDFSQRLGICCKKVRNPITKEESVYVILLF